MGNYAENVKIINELNAKDPSATYAVNQFSGMSFEEFSAAYLTLKSNPDAVFEVPSLQLDVAVAATAADWDVTPAKDQGNCGSCWSFGTMGAIEGMNKVKTGSSIILSEQQLIDCDHDCSGCGGGLTDYAYRYLVNKDLYTSQSYPYTSGSSGHAGSCRSGSSSGVTINGFFTVPGAGSGTGDDGLSRALMNGPVTVTVAADNQFVNYNSGILTGVSTQCNLNHAILATGFGSNFWKIKNSWGQRWGANGFAKFERTTRGCGPFGLFFQDAGFQPQMGSGPSPVPPSPTPPSPEPTPSPTPAPTGHYGRPPCQADEMYSTMDDQYEMCKPMCSSSCPSFSGSAEPVCEYGTCSLVCSGDDECPSGAVCLGTHRCWYPGTFTVV